MTRYVAWRLFLVLPTALLASVVVFVVMRALPGDVAANILSGSGEGPHSIEARERLRDELGLRDPLAVQYGRWLWSMVNGEFGGRSLFNREPVRSLLARQLPVTLLLTLYTTTLSVVVSVPAGVLAAARKGRWPDHLVRGMTVMGLALPHVWVGLLVLLALLLVFRWSPPVLYAHPWENLAAHAQTMVWPVLVLSLEFTAHAVRVVRANVVEAMGQDYVRTARSKGLSDRAVIVRHALPNALVPAATLFGLQLGTLLGGAIIIESVFGLPGLGRGLVQAAVARDYPMVQSVVTCLVTAMLLVNLAADLLYARLDPRIFYRT